MGKFIKKITIYISIVLLVLFLVNSWYLAFDKRDINNTNKFDDVPYEIQICNLGSSHGLYGFNYEAYEKEYTCFNFALNSQSLSYDARILENYKEHLAEGAVVFVTISYHSFFGIPETEEGNFESKNMRYYDFLPNDAIKNYDFKVDLMTKFPSLYAYETLPLALIGHYLDADTELSGWEAVIDEYDLPDRTVATLQKHLVTNKFDENGNRIYNQEEIDALYKIIEICESVGATPVLVTPPFSLIYNNLIDIQMSDFFDDFYAVMDAVAADTGITYYNYAKADAFNNDYTYFRDTDHLTKAGAALFTETVMNDIVYPMW